VSVALDTAFARAPRLWPLAAVGLLVALVSRLSYLMRPWDPDGAIFIYMGRLVAEGGVFWQDLVDNKLPTVGFLTSIAWRAIGPWWAGYVLLQTGLAILACLALGHAANRLAGPQAKWPAMLFGLVYLNLNTVVFGGFQLETIQVFFASLAAMAAAELLATPAPSASSPPLTAPSATGLFADAFALGLCAGCAALAKPTGLSILAAAGLAAAMRHARLPGRLLVIAAGASLGVGMVAAIVGIYLHGSGTLAHLPAIFDQIRLYARNSATDLRDLNKIVWAAGLLGFPLLGRWWAGRRCPHAGPAMPARAAQAFPWLWLGIELIGIILQRRMYGYHFLVLAPPAAIAFGMLRRPVTCRGLSIALAPALLLSAVGIGQVAICSRGYPRQLESGRWLAAHAHPRDRVWRDMTSRLLIETGLRPGSRYLLTFLFCNSDDAPQRYWSEMKADFDRDRPRWMVLPRDLRWYLDDTTAMVAELERLPQRRSNYLRAWGELEGYVHHHYRLVATLQRETVWERRPDSPDQGLRASR
jgi:hypothetical protein